MSSLTAAVSRRTRPGLAWWLPLGLGGRVSCAPAGTLTQTEWHESVSALM